MLFIVTLIVLFVRKNSIENTTISMKKRKGSRSSLCFVDENNRGGYRQNCFGDYEDSLVPSNLSTLLMKDCVSIK